jgi:hypothetical protein
MVRTIGCQHPKATQPQQVAQLRFEAPTHAQRAFAPGQHLAAQVQSFIDPQALEELSGRVVLSLVPNALAAPAAVGRDGVAPAGCCCPSTRPQSGHNRGQKYGSTAPCLAVPSGGGTIVRQEGCSPGLGGLSLPRPRFSSHNEIVWTIHTRKAGFHPTRRSANARQGSHRGQ